MPFAYSFGAAFLVFFAHLFGIAADNHFLTTSKAILYLNIVHAYLSETFQLS